MAVSSADSLVWISGASSGIGAALAASVPYPGARLIDISRSGGASGAEHLRADLADPSSWAAVEAHLVAQLDGFTGSRAVFIHSAGTLDPMGFAGAVDSAAYRTNVLLNSAAPQALGHAFLKAVAGADCRAHLVLLSSGAATRPYAGWSSYCAAKAAVDQWVRAVGLEQGPDGCTVLAVAPGVVATGMQELIRATDEAAFPAKQKFVDLHASGGLTDPADAARGIWALLERDDLDNGAVVDLRTL